MVCCVLLGGGGHFGIEVKGLFPTDHDLCPSMLLVSDSHLCRVVHIESLCYCACANFTALSLWRKDDDISLCAQIQTSSGPAISHLNRYKLL